MSLLKRQEAEEGAGCREEVEAEAAHHLKVEEVEELVQRLRHTVE